jgi:hypothetical protein
MWSRPAFRGSASRSPSSRVRRLSTIGGVLLALTAATAGPASAAPSDITVALSPVAPRISTVVKQTPESSTRGDVTVAYGGSLTVQFPPQVAPGPTTEFWLHFYDANFPPTGPLPGQQWNYRKGPADASGGPLTVTDLGGNAYGIQIPPVGMVDGLNNDHTAVLQVDGLSTTVPGGVPVYGDGLDARLYVSTVGPASASITSRLSVTGELPSVAVSAGGTIRLQLPTSSALRTAGMTSLLGTEITLYEANASNKHLDVVTSVSSDGRSATLRLPADLEPAAYGVWMTLDRPDLYVEGDFPVDISAPVEEAGPTPPSTSAAAPVTTPAPATTSAQPAPDGVVAAATPRPELRAASNGSAWVAWTGLGVAVVALAGGAGFLVRRRITHR